MTIISWGLRYLIIVYFNVDIFNVAKHPQESFLGLFGLNTIRVLVSSLLDYLLIPIPEGLDNFYTDKTQLELNTFFGGRFPKGSWVRNPDGSWDLQYVSPPRPPGLSDPPLSSTPVPPAPAPVPEGDSKIFTVLAGNYTIDDPSNVRGRRFTDVITNKLHNGSYQPYASNLAAALFDTQRVRRNNDFGGILGLDKQFAEDAVSFLGLDRDPLTAKNSLNLQTYLRNMK